MAEFQELIKNFDRIRDYMRQFYIYGFKVRNDYDTKSARTYDNERRRIESWLSGYTTSEYTSKGKKVYINVDSKAISQNPLYAAWKSKSFTDNDILLHFFLLDLLAGCPTGLTAGELCDRMSKEYGVVFDSQTVRLKLKEYAGLGLLEAKKEGKNLAYSMMPSSASNIPSAGFSDPGTHSSAVPALACSAPGSPSLWDRLITAITFFQEAAPFGIIGSTILDREDMSNELFQFKHHFIVHTLEDGVLLSILEAIKGRCIIEYENKSSRTGNVTTTSGLPLKIFVSTCTGRRYVCLYLPRLRRFSNARLDSISAVRIGDPFENYEEIQRDLNKNIAKCWGVSFGGGQTRIEEICVKLYIDEKKEPHVLNRLYREGRGGEVLKIRDNEYLYTGLFFDTNEMLSWIKSFTGRVLDIQGSNRFAIAKIIHDWDSMYNMYCKKEEG